jgi:hypothetical protein
MGSARCSSSPAAGAARPSSIGQVLQAGDSVPEATVYLGPNEPVTMAELVEDGPKLLVFYLFDWSST